MLDDRDRRLPERGGEIVGEAPRGVGIEEVEVAERHAAVLVHAIPPPRGADLPVAGARLVRVLAVAEVLHPLEGKVDGGRQRIARHVVEPAHDGGVVGGRVGEGRTGELALGLVGEHPAGLQLVDHRLVLRGMGEDPHLAEALRGSTDHRRTTDVDELLGAAGAVLEALEAGAEGVQVGHDQVDRLDAVLSHVLLVVGVAPVGEDPAVHLRVEGDDAVAEDRRRAGEVGDVGDGQVGLSQRLGRAPAGDQIPAEALELARQLHDAGLVVDGEQRPHASGHLVPVRRAGSARTARMVSG